MTRFDERSQGVRLRLSRRQFVQGLSGGALLLSAGTRASGSATSSSATELSGNEFALTIGELPVSYTGARRRAIAVNGQVPAPLLRFREGETVTLRVSNRLSVRSSIHWHGLIVPADMDGVPGLSFEGIPPGGTYAYRFKVNQSGTYWYHSHSRFQEQTGLYGPIVIEPREGPRQHADRDYVVMLSDWSDLDPERIYATLKKDSSYFNTHKRTVSDFTRDVRQNGLKAALAERRMWGEMRMSPTDLADVTGYTYTYLLNGVTPGGNWTGLFRRGERVRLRFINGSSMSIFDVRIPGLKLTVVAADGQDVEPVTVDEFRISVAEVYDVIVEPKDDRAYTIFAQSMDRSGYARGTLAPAAGMNAEIPKLDTRVELTMADMGMSGMSGMDMSQMDMSSMQNMPQHAPTESGPTVDMQAMELQKSINDPGVGLRNNGRHVLTYADLHTLGGPIDQRAPSRELTLHLTGHMERFIWSFNGQKFSEAEPLRFNYGERLRITLVNDSMMTHPIHLHGMWSELENEKGEFQVRKHTVNVNPAQQVSYAVTADALGRWAYHCHLLYHMEAGMFREVVVAPGEGLGGHS